ncbi:MAG TPA: hypothetical protein PKI68_07630 [Pontiellaceae bacterium]|nr:hypothetical protein [Pontiellaceae bacterium]
MKERKFPFIPKSSKGLEIGDFWSIPLDGGRFACGRVIGMCPVGWRASQRGFFAGLLDWVSDSPPTAAGIAGVRTLIQGGAHIKTILATGGTILGNRSLEEDGIMPQLFIEFPDNRTAYVFRGMEQLRVASQEEIRSLPKLSTFGFMYMRTYANTHLHRRA